MFPGGYPVHKLLELEKLCGYSHFMMQHYNCSPKNDYLGH